jgi:hypothetical protein
MQVERRAPDGGGPGLHGAGPCPAWWLVHGTTAYIQDDGCSAISLNTNSLPITADKDYVYKGTVAVQLKIFYFYVCMAQQLRQFGDKSPFFIQSLHVRSSSLFDMVAYVLHKDTDDGFSDGYQEAKQWDD